jgi:hypothetical protein
MGAWGFGPFDNDNAVELLMDINKKSNIYQTVRHYIYSSVNILVTSAAIEILMGLADVGIVDHDVHYYTVEHAVNRLEIAIDTPAYTDEYRNALRKQLERLQQYRKAKTYEI